jgi:Flp pilus assembly pilin Flp
MRSILTSLKKEEGQSAIEFALVLPLILIVILIIIQIGIVVNAQLIITHAAREGARDGSVTNSNSKITESVKKTASTLDENSMSIYIKPPSNRKIGDYITVIVKYNPPIIFPGIELVFPNSINLSSSATMRIEKE